MTEPDNAKSEKLYGALMSLHIHQDRLLWSRVQLLIAVQGAVLAGSYALRPHWLAPAILGLGAVLTRLLISLVKKDQLDRDVNKNLLDKLGCRLLPADLRKCCYRIRLTSDIPNGSPVLRGRHVLWIVLWGFFGLDLLLGVLYVLCKGAFPTTGY